MNAGLKFIALSGNSLPSPGVNGVKRQLDFTQFVKDFLTTGRRCSGVVAWPIVKIGETDFTFTPGTLAGVDEWLQFMVGISKSIWKTNVPIGNLYPFVEPDGYIPNGLWVKTLEVTWPVGMILPDLYLTTYRVGYPLARGNRVVYRQPGPG